MNRKDISTDDAVIVERIFNASREQLWQMWTDPEHFKHWYGPQGFIIPVADITLEVGGRRLVCMASPDGKIKMWTVGEFKEIVYPEKLIYTESPADENGNVVSPAQIGIPEEYPTVTEVTVLFEDLSGKTRLTLTHAGVPTASGAGGGWEQAFDKLADYLKETR